MGMAFIDFFFFCFSFRQWKSHSPCFSFFFWTTKLFFLVSNLFYILFSTPRSFVFWLVFTSGRKEPPMFWEKKVIFLFQTLTKNFAVLFVFLFWCERDQQKKKTKHTFYFPEPEFDCFLSLSLKHLFFPLYFHFALLFVTYSFPFFSPRIFFYIKTLFTNYLITRIL